MLKILMLIALAIVIGTTTQHAFANDMPSGGIAGSSETQSSNSAPTEQTNTFDFGHHHHTHFDGLVGDAVIRESSGSLSAYNAIPFQHGSHEGFFHHYFGHHHHGEFEYGMMRGDSQATLP